MSEGFVLGDVISVSICEHECRYEVAATWPADLEPLSDVSYPEFWDPLPFLQRHTSIQSASDARRFKADLKSELVKAHFVNVQRNGSTVTRRQAAALQALDEVDCLVRDQDQVQFGVRLDKSKTGGLLAASVRRNDDINLSPLLIVAMPMQATEYVSQMEIRLVWSSHGRDALRELNIDLTMLNFCPVAAGCDEQIVDIKSKVEDNIERRIAASLEMSIRRTSLLKALGEKFGGVVSSDPRKPVYGFVCTAGLTTVVVKLEFSRGQLQASCKPDIYLLYPDLSIRDKSPYVAPAQEACWSTAPSQYTNKEWFSLLSPSIQTDAQTLVDWDVDEPKDLARHIYARVVCKILSDVPKPARKAGV